MLLMAVSTEGEVRGYLPVGMGLATADPAAAAAAEDNDAPVSAQATADPAHERMLQELLQRKMVNKSRACHGG